MNQEVVLARSAIESLRSGVPSRDAVDQLGTTQHDLIERFEKSMDALKEGGGVTPIIISATFGGGKTHLLEYMQSLAEKANFVTSYSVISPEMPLGNSLAVLKTLCEAAHAPNQEGKAVRALAAGLSTDSQAYQKLQSWAQTTKIDDRFLALLEIYKEYRADEELRIRILDDFEGHPLPKTEIKNRLKQIGQQASFNLIGGPRNNVLAHDRILLTSQFFRACGSAGWVVLFDEMERVAKLTWRQRLAAYTELGWWKQAAERAGSALLPVFTTASGFLEDTVTGGTNDAQLLTSGGFALENRDQLALQGIELLKSPVCRIQPLSPEEEEKIMYRVREIYQTAYGELASLPDSRKLRTTIRSEIRRWITLWDLQRYYPNYKPVVEEDPMPFDPKVEYEDNPGE